MRRLRGGRERGILKEQEKGVAWLETPRGGEKREEYREARESPLSLWLQFSFLLSSDAHSNLPTGLCLLPLL